MPPRSTRAAHSILSCEYDGNKIPTTTIPPTLYVSRVSGITEANVVNGRRHPLWVGTDIDLYPVCRSPYCIALYVCVLSLSALVPLKSFIAEMGVGASRWNFFSVTSRSRDIPGFSD